MISVRIICTAPKFMPTSLAIIRKSRLLSHIIRLCTISTFSSVVAALGRPGLSSSSMLSLPRLNSAAHFFHRVIRRRLILKCFHEVFVYFLRSHSLLTKILYIFYYKANISDTEAPFLDLHLSVANGFVSSKIYDKRDDFDFDIVNFPFLDGDVPRRASYGVYISQLIRFARVCNHVTDFNARNKSLTAKLLQQGYRYHKLRKTFSKFYRRHYELISKYNVGLKTLLSEGLSEPEFFGDLVYKFKKLIGSNDFSFQFRKIITRYRRIGYNLNVMRQSACLVFNPITVDNYAAFFNCTPMGRASDSMMAPT